MKRIIPCLDVKESGVVKGVKFQNLRSVGDPVELAVRYDAQGADELVFLDVSATLEGRGPLLHILERVSERVFLPVTAGGESARWRPCATCSWRGRTRWP